VPDISVTHIAAASVGPRTPFEAHPSEARPGSVLVVDSDAGVCRVIALVLQEVGCETRAAHDAESALELVDALDPDLVIAEVRLPAASGSELAREIREHGHPDTRVVLMSAYPRPPMGAEDYFLQKPLRFERLLDIARSATG
jgi:two-component system nitrogen regulation response regulator NtrX